MDGQERDTFLSWDAHLGSAVLCDRTSYQDGNVSLDANMDHDPECKHGSLRLVRSWIFLLHCDWMVSEGSRSGLTVCRGLAAFGFLSSVQTYSIKNKMKRRLNEDLMPRNFN